MALVLYLTNTPSPTFLDASLPTMKKAQSSWHKGAGDEETWQGWQQGHTSIANRPSTVSFPRTAGATDCIDGSTDRSAGTSSTKASDDEGIASTFDEPSDGTAGGTGIASIVGPGGPGGTPAISVAASMAASAWHSSRLTASRWFS
ncbi:hypothetical protein M406DRAFT_75489 [Cryphonectria parasitica EP155]|uniref:Uncharacterized protein n=1 Tax=Cryphonectria parasitica (strain ATCC 38755 / EP155) TaxID=660469 RepID=A0A9P4Y820_CRYP1|nr:uncharacterized protein M406DRAFT_75489 [Cryphonectria parasitica EP155]KAF3768248.1 hypothetical protein M406DRAFT_75489 [Cryphonectria parasitica EP155]